VTLCEEVSKAKTLLAATGVQTKPAGTLCVKGKESWFLGPHFTLQCKTAYFAILRWNPETWSSV